MNLRLARFELSEKLEDEFSNGRREMLRCRIQLMLY